MQVFHGLSPSIIKNIFQVNTNNPYSLRSHNKLYCRNPKIVKYGTETISYLGTTIWLLVPETIKSSKTDIFKNKISKWKLDCPFRLCKTYLQHFGFISSKLSIFIDSRMWEKLEPLPWLEPVEYLG